MPRRVRRKLKFRGQALLKHVGGDKIEPADITVEMLDPSDQPGTVFDEGAVRIIVEGGGRETSLTFAMGLGDLRYAIRPISDG